MLVYLVSFDDINKYSKKVNEYGYTGVCWQTQDEYIIEVPRVSVKTGAATGIVFRANISKKFVFEIMNDRLPSMPEDEDLLGAFEQMFLGGYLKVLGKHGETDVSADRFIYAVSSERQYFDELQSADKDLETDEDGETESVS